MSWAPDPANGAFRMAVGNFRGLAGQYFAEPTSDSRVDGQITNI